MLEADVHYHKCHQGLLEAYVAEMGRSLGDPRRAANLAAAVCELLRGHAALGDHAVGLGYADRLLVLLTARVRGQAPGQSASFLEHLVHEMCTRS